MSDEELVKRLRMVTGFIRFETGDRVAASACLSEEAADRIEQLVAINEALTEQLEAARADAKEAEAYAEELEVMNKNQEAMIRQADDRGDAWRFRADIAEAKLASGVIAEYDDDSTVFLSGYAGGAAIGGAWSTLTLMEKASDGTLRVREYKAQGDWRATLAKIEGEKG